MPAIGFTATGEKPIDYKAIEKTGRGAAFKDRQPHHAIPWQLLMG